MITPLGVITAVSIFLIHMQSIINIELYFTSLFETRVQKRFREKSLRQSTDAIGLLAA